MRIDRRSVLEFLRAIGLGASIIGAGFSVSLCGIGIGIYVLARLAGGAWEFGVSRRSLILGACFLVALLGSVLKGADLYLSFRGYWKYLEGFILFCACLDVVKNRQMAARVLMVMVTVLTLSAVDGLIQAQTGTDLVNQRRPVDFTSAPVKSESQGTRESMPQVTRLVGPFKHSNDYGTYLATGLLLVLALGLGTAQTLRRRLGSTVLIALFSASVYVLYLTFSFGALLSFFVSLTVFFWIGRQRKFAVLLFACLLAMGLLSDSFMFRIRNLIEHGYSNTQERVLLARIALKMTEDSPVFGLGLNSYSQNFPKYKPSDYRGAMYAHNSFLQIAAEAGILNLLLFIILIGSELWNGIRKVFMLQGRDRLILSALCCGVIAFLLNSLFDSCLQSTQLRTLFWIQLGMSAAFSRIAFPKTYDPAR